MTTLATRIQMTSVFEDSAGNAQPSIPYRVFQKGTTTPVTVYGDAAKGITLIQPVIGTVLGLPGDVYVDPGEYDISVLGVVVDTVMIPVNPSDTFDTTGLQTQINNNSSSIATLSNELTTQVEGFCIQSGGTYPTRPTAGSVEWRGTTDPSGQTGFSESDTWVDLS